MADTHELPVIDVSPLVTASAISGDADVAVSPGIDSTTGSRSDVEMVAREIDLACRRDGFFRIIGHGIDPGLFDRMNVSARDFFDRPEAEKAEVAMARAGAAWRGWFPVGGELTSGRPDRKEGLYVGLDHALVICQCRVY